MVSSFRVLAFLGLRWALGLSLAEGLPALDRPALAYYVGSEKHDPLATLAFSYYAAPAVKGSSGAREGARTLRSICSAVVVLDVGTHLLLTGVHRSKRCMINTRVDNLVWLPQVCLHRIH